MAEVKESIEIDVPVSTAYNQWTQFEEFPSFMENAESVTQLDDTHLRWVAEIGGRREEWKAEITHQQPDKVVAWRSVEGRENSGRVEFEPLGSDRTRIDVTMTWEPDGVVESAADKIGFLRESRQCRPRALQGADRSSRRRVGRLARRGRRGRKGGLMGLTNMLQDTAKRGQVEDFVKRYD
jgi:uncharacterized membrane protein